MIIDFRPGLSEHPNMITLFYEPLAIKSLIPENDGFGVKGMMILKNTVRMTKMRLILLLSAL